MPRLTSVSHDGGCGCKVARAILEQLIAKVEGPHLIPSRRAGIFRSGQTQRDSIGPMYAFVAVRVVDPDGSNATPT